MMMERKQSWDRRGIIYSCAGLNGGGSDSQIDRAMLLTCTDLVRAS